jgi:hypothetical protein
MTFTERAAKLVAMPFGFRLEFTSGGARAGTITTDHGAVRTPVFMPVGTQATVKAILPSALRDNIDARIILGNAYPVYVCHYAIFIFWNVSKFPALPKHTPERR